MKTTLLFLAFLISTVSAFAGNRAERYDTYAYVVDQAPILHETGFDHTDVYVLVKEWADQKVRRTLSLSTMEPGHLKLWTGSKQSDDAIRIGQAMGCSKDTMIDFVDSYTGVLEDMNAVKKGDKIIVLQGSRTALICFYFKGQPKSCHFERTLRW